MPVAGAQHKRFSENLGGGSTFAKQEVPSPLGRRGATSLKMSKGCHQPLTATRMRPTDRFTAPQGRRPENFRAWAALGA